MKSSIILAILITAIVICTGSIGPLESVGRQMLARFGTTKHLGDQTLTTNPGIVPVIRLPDFEVRAQPREPDGIQQPLRAAAATSPADSSPSDPDLVAVRNWLKTHRDGANYEIVKWWPAKPVDNDLVDSAGLLKTDRVARLQYRDNPSSGEPSIRDEVFVIRNNEARPVPGGQNWWWNDWGGWTQLINRGARRLLPADGDVQTPPIADSAKPPLVLPTKLVAHHPKRTVSVPNRKHRKRGRQEPWWVKFADEADVDLVRDWLKENLPAGHEIRWWKPRDLIAYGWSRNPRRSAVLPVEDAGRRAPFLLASGRRPDRRTFERVCRIKLRVEEPNQPSKVEDRLFTVSSGRVEPIRDPQHKRREWKYFPDAAGTKSTSSE